MKFAQSVTYIVESWKALRKDAAHSTPVALLGPPGIGKTSIGRAVAEAMTDEVQSKNPNAEPARCWVLDLSSMLPEDLGGVPFRFTGTDGSTYTDYAPQKWMSSLMDEGAYGILVLDDLPAANPSVQVAARQLVLERRVHDHKISDGIVILVTGNRREDKSAASTLPAHFRNSIQLLSVEPELDSWADWYGTQPDHAPVIASFLRFRPSHFSRLPKDADSMGAFATPRTWAKLGRLFEVAKATKNTFPVAGALVGEGVATEFVAFLNTRDQLVDPARVLHDPLKAMPNPLQTLDTPDKAYALTTGLGEVAAAWATGDKKELRRDAPLALLRATGHITDGNREYIAVAVSTYLSNGGDAERLLSVAGEHADDKLVDEVLTFLSNTFRS